MNAVRKAVTVRQAYRDIPYPVVQSVRGRYMGHAYVNVQRVFEHGMKIGPGEVQLSSLHHPASTRLTNTLLFGTFKGKLSDWDGDDELDVNIERCHGTTDGRLDADLDGVEDVDPFSIATSGS